MITQGHLEEGRRLYREKRYAEAVPLLRSALESAGGVEEVWQELVLAVRCGVQSEVAVDVGKEAVRHYPHSAWLWRELGNALIKCDRLDEAEKALANARSLEPGAEWLWRYLAALHKKQKDTAKQMAALERLSALGKASANDFCTLGIACHNERDFGKAIWWYRRSFMAEVEDRKSYV